MVPASPAAAAVPTAVNSCQVQLNSGSPTVRWSGGSGANRYIVYRNGGVRTRADGSSYTDTRTANNTLYNYSISPVNNDGRGPNTYCGAVRTGNGNGNGNSSVTAPTSCSIAPILRKEVRVTWSGGNGDRFIVRRNGSWLARTGANARNHDDLRAEHGRRYTYTVETVRSGVASARTNCGTINIPPPGNSWNRPSTPANCSVNRSSGSNRITWSSVPGTYYIVYRNGGWRGRVDGNTSFTDTRLASGADYTYTIQARNGSGFSNIGTCSG